jgi:peptide-methionine (S)-S-oxide reductase
MTPRLIPALVAAATALAAAGSLAQQDATTMTKDGQAVATFAGGCFWCMEPPYDKLEGVLATTSGYTGGSKTDPTYQEVSAGGTGHAEAVQVTYDPAKVSYEQLLEVFWRNVDPLDAGGQFCDRGDQYRTAIFAHGDEQRQLAEQSKQALVDSGRFEQPIVTEVEEAGAFYPAEDYHQDYATLHPQSPYIVAFDAPKIANLKQLMPEIYREKPVLVASQK